MRFGAHQTFHLRDSWLYKGINSVQANGEQLFSPSAAEELGIGKNMVESIKYWLLALQFVKKEEQSFSLTPLAETIFEFDPYFELDGTLILTHYLLASNIDEATSWFWFFNKLGANEFDSDSLNVYLQNYVENAATKKIHPGTLKKDINCILRMYKAPDYAERVTPETENPSPFVKFGIIKEENKKFVKGKFSPTDIDSHIFSFLLFHYWTNHLNEAESVSLEQLTEQEFSPGIILGLNLEEMSELIEKVNRDHGDRYLTYSRTGGYFIMNLKKRTIKAALTNYYKDNKFLVD